MCFASSYAASVCDLSVECHLPLLFTPWSLSQNLTGAQNSLNVCGGHVDLLYGYDMFTSMESVCKCSWLMAF